MKMTSRIFILWVVPLILLLSTISNSHAGDFKCTTNAGTITITGYTGTGGVVNIPDLINGLPVVLIGNSAFYYCSALTSVTIPVGVTNILGRAFQGCTKLASVSIPNSVVSLEGYAFHGCTKLTNVTIPALSEFVWVIE